MQFEDDYYQNHNYLQTYFNKRGISCLSIPLPPVRKMAERDDQEIMSEYYERMSKFDAVDQMVAELSEKHSARIENLEGMAERAHRQIWYPFTQHRDLSPTSIAAVDSACGDFFQTYLATSSNGHGNQGILMPTFDGSASWWTQGLGHGNPELSLSAAYAAGRYGVYISELPLLFQRIFETST
jgi:dethiobiotin synthetase/adenosylmethionine--8-amino-7-oxononanoate aminotransferase